MNHLNELILLFFIYSVIGWLWETLYCSLKAHKFVYRGFLVGPYCPIYGFGVLLVLLLVSPYQKNVIFLYIFSTCVVTILEYVTSFLLEIFFHATWWDYKDVPFNLNGRVALPVSLFWGVGCLLIVKVVQPFVLILAEHIEGVSGGYIPSIIAFIMFADSIYTLCNMISLQKISKVWSGKINEVKAEFAEKQVTFRKEKVAWLSEFTNEKKKNLPKFNFNQRRMLANFRQLKIKEIDNLDELILLYKQKKKQK